MSSSFDESAAAKIVTSLSVAEINALRESISNNLSSNPEYLTATTTSFYTAIVEAMNSCDKSVEILRALFELAAAVFSGLTEDQRTAFTDEGVCFSINDVLDSGNTDVKVLICEFITRVTQQSDYICDAFFSVDVYDSLIAMVKDGEEPLQIAASNALFRLFGDHASILSTILVHSLPLLLDLLRIDSKKAKCYILKALTEVTNQRCSLCPQLLEKGNIKLIVDMLDDDELRSSVLPLIGNLCLSVRDHLEEMFKLQLPRKLLQLTRTDEYAADAFWALSNLMEGAPDLFSSYEISEEKVSNFITLVIEKAHGESLQLRKEAVFFLASLIMFASKKFTEMFMRKDVFDIIVKVLMIADDDAVKNRFLDVFNRFCINVQHNEETFAKFQRLTHECGIIEQFEQLKQHEDSFFAQKIQDIEENIRQLEKEHGANDRKGMEIDVRHLLKFATKIEKQLKRETDPRATESLRSDLEKIKAEIGKRILDIPRERPLEPIFEQKPSKKHAQSEFVLKEPGSPASLRRRPQAHSMVTDKPPSRIVQQFEEFIAQRQNTSPKRRPRRAQTPQKRRRH